MKAVQVAPDVWWVGGIDWRLRNFHGYATPRGSTYNAYLIIDEKITLIDTVKESLFDEMMERISSVIDPHKIDYLISNHAEMDHSGSVPLLDKFLTGKKIFASQKGVPGLKEHFGHLDIEAVKTGDTLNIGKRTLQFITTPMVHWPDNMVTWSPEDRILFSNDAFGQHLASPQRFDDEYPVDIIMDEAKKYYANIVLPYDQAVLKALRDVGSLPMEMIAPAHGIIWRSNVAQIVENYRQWAHNETKDKAVIAYDSMWGSTKMMAHTFASVCEDFGISAHLINLQDTHISDVMNEAIDARYIFVGSPTLNNGMLPTVSAFLTYLKGLAPKHRVGLAFGSYGWGGHGVKEVQEMLERTKMDLLEPLTVKFVPDEATLLTLKEQFRSALAEKIATTQK